MILVLLIILSSFVYAAGEISQFADKLNYWNSEMHTVSVTNNGVEPIHANFSIPTGFSFNSGTCTVPVAGTIQCVLASGQTKYYAVDSSTLAEYELSPFVPVANNSYTGNNVSFLRIKDDEIFHTLVEYGRGRGNYFFDSMGGGLAGSGHSGTGCAYLPNGTMFELNFLHKVLNIKQYFGLANADAKNVTFSCTYPNRTVVREHLITSILRSAGLWSVDYFINTVEGSWERMGYLGMDFDVGEYLVGQNISVNCTDLRYILSSAGGNISITEDSFDLEVRDRNPFSVTASTTTGTVGNGTQEVLITYTITNNEVYDISDAIIEIEAPQYAKFIGTRGELWGVGRDIYRLEKTEIQAGQSETIDLVARFDTSSAPSISSLELSQGVDVKYTTCWEANAYNPQEYLQYLNVVNNVSVNMGTPVGIVDLVNLLTSLNTTVNNFQSTMYSINATVDNIWNLTWQINQSIDNLPYKVWTFYSRNLTYYAPAAEFNISISGGIGGAGGGVACRWNSTEHYTNALENSNFYQVYGSRWLRVDYPGIYNDSVDLYRSCYRIAPTSGTAGGNDLLQVYMCNDYDGVGNPETESGCTLIEAYDLSSESFSPDIFKWECKDIMGKAINGANISILFECENCAGTGDGWKIAMDTLSTSNYTYNSSNDGSSWTIESNESVVEWDWCVPIDFGFEVWSYNNRTLSENISCAAGTCNITTLLNQFNCSNGAATNKMCEIIYAINETSNNLWSTIQTMNNTLNNVWSYSQSIYSDTQSIIDSLNCNGTVDSPICNLTVSLNQSIVDLTNTVNNINSSINSINNTLYVMDQSIANQFNYTWQLINNMSVNVGNLSISMNCSDPQNNYSDSVCAYIQRVETNTININTTVIDILDVVKYINGTRWGNITAWDLYSAIQNQSTTISTNFQNILSAINRLQEFDEELVFLVTDAFGLQQSAKRDIDNGDLSAAANKLQEANNQLNAAAVKLIEVQNDTLEQGAAGGSDFTWVLAFVALIAVGSLSFYMFSRPRV